MVTELADGIWWFDLQGVNAYLFEDDGDATLIDAGAPWTSGALLDDLDDAGFRPRDVSRIALTHYDLDHVGALNRFGTDVTVYAGDPDGAILRGERDPPWNNRKTAFQRASRLIAADPEQPVETVAEGDRIGGLDVYGTPGHTPGHLTFVSEERSVAFVGDLLRESDGRIESSPWVLSHDTGAVKSSIRRLAELDLDVEILAMGHGTPFVERGGVHLSDLAGRL
ncbi:MBL fold metallo-hydrolase [Halorhabdus amylolytica]|uniref:MBL fold metallo-hydrolase n=1 Tax=Halorhabdus amylolytica TaxID=2559573 RepID=UPI0010A9C696|nr:MBL fold metallo-hydrolase [Halorhabdus amylolytica]